MPKDKISKQASLTKRRSGSGKSQEVVTHGVPRCLAITERGINNGAEFAACMSALMSDLVSGRISSGVGNAVSNAGGKLLKICEMQFKYGTPKGDRVPKSLSLTLSKS